MKSEEKNLNRGLTTGPHPSVGGIPAQLPCSAPHTRAHATAGARQGTAVARRSPAGGGRPTARPGRTTARVGRRSWGAQYRGKGTHRAARDGAAAPSEARWRSEVRWQHPLQWTR